MNRAFSADGFVIITDPGAGLPQANMKSAPTALNTYGQRRTDGRLMKRANCRSERRATIVDFSYIACGIRMLVESCRGADLQGFCASSV